MNRRPLIKRHMPPFATLKNTLLVIVGTFVLAFGTGIFIIPNDLVTGGVSGIGIILGRVFGGVRFLGALSVEVYASVLNCILFVIGLVFLGRAFAMKTLVSTFVYPVALWLAGALADSGLFGGFFDLNSPLYAEFGQISVLLAAVFGGAAIGAGCALTFLGGGSTGGMDILALCVCKRFKRLKSSMMIFIFDAAIVALGMFVIGNMVISLLGIVSALICAVVIDRVFLGGSKAFIAQIISDRCDRISEQVIARLKRTTTTLDVVGGYSGEHRKMLMVTFSMNQYAELFALVSQTDKNAFITVHRAHEINGEGWTYYIDNSLEEKESED